jgi:hypothetical protein
VFTAPLVGLRVTGGGSLGLNRSHPATKTSTRTPNPHSATPFLIRNLLSKIDGSRSGYHRGGEGVKEDLAGRRSWVL